MKDNFTKRLIYNHRLAGGHGLTPLQIIYAIAIKNELCSIVKVKNGNVYFDFGGKDARTRALSSSYAEFLLDMQDRSPVTVVGIMGKVGVVNGTILRKTVGCYTSFLCGKIGTRVLGLSPTAAQYDCDVKINFEKCVLWETWWASEQEYILNKLKTSWCNRAGYKKKTEKGFSATKYKWSRQMNEGDLVKIQNSIKEHKIVLAYVEPEKVAPKNEPKKESKVENKKVDDSPF